MASSPKVLHPKYDAILGRGDFNTPFSWWFRSIMVSNAENLGVTILQIIFWFFNGTNVQDAKSPIEVMFMRNVFFNIAIILFIFDTQTFTNVILCIPSEKVMRIAWRILAPVIALMIGNPIQSQKPVEDGIEWLDNLPDEALEQLQESSSILGDLQDLRDNPLDLNEVEFRDLELLNLLTPAEINSILQ